MIQAAKILNLKRLLDHIQKVCLRISSILIITEDCLKALRIAQKYDLSLFFERQSIGSSWLESFRLIDNQNFKALSREMRYELLKNSVIHHLKTLTDRFTVEKEFLLDAVGMEIQMIFNFLDLVVHENRIVDLAVTKSTIFTPKNFYLTFLENCVKLDSISCNQGDAIVRFFVT